MSSSSSLWPNRFHLYVLTWKPVNLYCCVVVWCRRRTTAATVPCDWDEWPEVRPVSKRSRTPPGLPRITSSRTVKWDPADPLGFEHLLSLWWTHQWSSPAWFRFLPEKIFIAALTSIFYAFTLSPLLQINYAVAWLCVFLFEYCAAYLQEPWL